MPNIVETKTAANNAGPEDLPIRIVVLGGGTQGRLIAQDLASRPDVHEVIVGDIHPLAELGPKTEWRPCDATSSTSVADLLDGAHAAVTALPGDLGRLGLHHAMQAGIPVVDISFTPDDLQGLDPAARESGATVVVDCGVAPGLSHLLAGAAHEMLGGLDRLTIHVGGIPITPLAPFLHAVYFHPDDLLAEYVRPARHRHGGALRAPHPMAEPPIVHDDPAMGRHEAFVTDGLRTLLASYPEVPDMVERTLRRPGHLEYMNRLAADGHLAPTPEQPGSEAPVRKTARLLAMDFPGDDHPDYLLMTVEGVRGGKRRAWRLYDRADEGVSAMARTTGFTAAAVAMQLARRKFDEPGVHPPERLAHVHGLVDEVLGDLDARGVRIEVMS